MANTSSAKKRINVIAKKQMRNKSVKTYTKTVVKKFHAAVEAGDTAQMQELFKVAVKAIDQAASKGIFHKNNASRKVSQLAKMMNK